MQLFNYLPPQFCPQIFKKNASAAFLGIAINSLHKFIYFGLVRNPDNMILMRVSRMHLIADLKVTFFYIDDLTIIVPMKFHSSFVPLNSK